MYSYIHLCLIKDLSGNQCRPPLKVSEVVKFPTEAIADSQGEISSFSNSEIVKNVA